MLRYVGWPSSMIDDRSPPSATEMQQDWDAYWAGRKHTRVERSAYDVVASFYRNVLIRPTLNRVIKAEFLAGARLLHAGSGGGEVDADLVGYAQITALDISPNAADLYRSRYSGKARAVVGNLFDLSTLGETFDGAYNLGVMEHFSEDQIVLILRQLHDTLAPGGRVVILWPPVYGLSVLALHVIHFVLNGVLRRNIALHPAEPTKFASRAQAERLFSAAGFALKSISFGPSDAFTYAIVVGVRN